ncbi:MAG TPA: alkaline phosphatase family protein [Acidimicrobiia bacterium]|nr:alkaline phosphatase family protein [Acidimicrobiia bacterium]
MTILFIVIDGLGSRSVTPQVMPTLTDWGHRGLIRPKGATSVMCSSTYPNFASIVTGRLATEHGIMTNQVVVGGVARPASEIGPRTETFLDHDCEVVVGDQHLIGVMAAPTAGRHWPPDGIVPGGVVLDLFGYVTDNEVATRVLDALDRRPALIFAQLNSPDTFAHVHGPDSEEAIESYRALDSTLDVIGSAMRWDRDLVLVTSDHDQETVDPSARIDLQGVATDRGLDVTIVDEGTAAMLAGPSAVQPTWIEGIPGIAGWDQVASDVVLVSSIPGWWFADADLPDLRGAHGGPRTRATVAVAAGAEAQLQPIADRFLGDRLGAEDWFDLVQIARDTSLNVESGT